MSVNYQRGEPGAPLAGCPARDELVRAIQQRGVRLDSAVAVGRARALDVTIRVEAGSYVGELVVHSPVAGKATRTVHDEDCSEVVSGLALTAAIALGGGGESGAEAESPWPAEADVSASERPPAAERGAPLSPSAVEAGGEASRLRGSSLDALDALEVPAGTLNFQGATAYTLTAGAHWGLLPGRGVPRYDLNASLASFLTPPGADSRLFGPLLQVHWAVLGPTSSQHAGTELELWGIEAGLNSCAALSYDTLGWVSLVCAEFGAGWSFLDATSSAVSTKSSQTLGYGFGGLALDVQYNILGWAHLGARLGGRLTTPTTVESADGSPLFDTSLWVGYASVGLGVQF